MADLMVRFAVFAGNIRNINFFAEFLLLFCEKRVVDHNSIFTALPYCFEELL